MPEIIFQRLKSTATGVGGSTGKQTETAFNDNFTLVKTLLEQLFAVASITVTSEQITQLKADTTTTPYTLYYTTDTEEPITWTRLMNVGFADLSGQPTDNIALNSALTAKANQADLATLTLQVSGNSSSIEALQGAVADRVRVPHEDVLYLRYNSTTGGVQYSLNGSTYVDISAGAATYATIGGQASDSASLVNYVAGEIATTLVTISNTYATQNALSAHENNQNNPHSVTKAQVGLGNVDNTSDIDKPISNAVQAALNNITTNAAPTSCMTPDGYRANTYEEGTNYFTSSGFTVTI